MKKISEISKKTILQTYKLLKEHVNGTGVCDEAIFWDLFYEVELLKFALPNPLCEEIDVILERMKNVLNEEFLNHHRDYCYQELFEIEQEIERAFGAYKKLILKA